MWAECGFLMIRREVAHGPAWERFKKHAELTDDEIWLCYEAWCDGKVHDILKKRIARVVNSDL